MIAHGRCPRNGLATTITNCVCASVCVILIANDAGCSPSAREHPSAQFAQFQNSVANSDTKSLVGMLSHATLRELRAHGGTNGLADEYARFLIAALRPGCPLDVDSHHDDENAATFYFVGQVNGTRGRVSFVYEDKRWSLDLVGPAGEWIGLRKWAQSVSKSIAVDGGKVGSLAGVEMVRPSPDEALFAMFGVPGVTDDREEEKGTEEGKGKQIKSDK
jgi:hypothetical protein